MDVKEARILDVSEPLSRALDEVLRSGTAVFVVRNRQLFGLIDDRNISMGISDPSRAKCEHASVKCPSVKENAGVEERIDAFLTGHFKALPVVDAKGFILGSTSRSDLLREMCKLKFIPKVQIYQHMTKPAYTIDASQSVADAKSLMKKTGVHRLVVTRAGNVAGVISTLDFLGLVSKPSGRKGEEFISEVKNTDSKRIVEFLREKFVSLPETATLEEAAEKMAAESVSSLVVVDGSKPIGLISATGIFKAVRGLFATEKEVMVSGLDPDSLVYYGSIKNEILGVIKKFDKSFDITNISIHVKKGKSVYEASLHLDLGSRPVSLHCEGHQLGDAIALLSKELKIILEKAKSEKMELKKPPRESG